MIRAMCYTLTFKILDSILKLLRPLCAAVGMGEYALQGLQIRKCAKV
jgi:hypothetical protein